MTEYYNRFNPSQNYEKHLFVVNKALQSPELNEIQDAVLYKQKLLGDALFKDGDVINGCECIVQDTSVIVSAGRLYLRGAVRDIPSATLAINKTLRYNIGLYLKEQTVTYLEDPTLRDPAVGTRAYNEPGANRLRYVFTWAALQTGSVPDVSLGDFYPVFEVDEGVLVTSGVASGVSSEVDAVSTALARYDKDSNGSYVVSGFGLQYQGATTTQQTFILNEGKAHVDGFEVEIPYSSRLTYDLDPDLSTIASEPHSFVSGNAEGWMTIQLDNRPVHSIQVVDILQQKTVTLTHGAFNGAVDTIPDTSIQEIVQIVQGETAYEQNTDFRLQAGSVDWSLTGAEPAPGSTYSVTYRARTHVAPANITEDGFDVQNAVPNSLVLVDYKWKMPRYDLITLDRNATITRNRGISHQYHPAIPKPPAGQLALGHIHQNWKTSGTNKPIVTSTITQAISMSDLQTMKKAIADLYDFVAEERLKNDANSRDPATKKGLFVDPFFDDDMRDLGVEQNAAIVDQCLQLPISVTVMDTAANATPWLLPFTLEPIVEQLSRTSSMKINPYQAFEPLPVDVQLTPATDRWTVVDSTWTSSSTSRFSTTATTAEAGYLRQISLVFKVDKMAPFEEVQHAFFDGLEVDITPA